MAQGKNTIIVYKDWYNIFKKLTNEEAGILVKHLFSYVNDENPILEDRFLDLAFTPIQDALKRDLKIWEEVREKRSESGKIGGAKSGESRSKAKQTKQVLKKASKKKQSEANEAVIVIDTDSVIDIDNDIEKKEVHTPSKFDVFNDWLKKNYPNVASMKTQMTEQNLKSLIDLYGKEVLNDHLMQMENKIDLTKKYKSVYLTLLTWIKRNTKK